VVANPGLCVTRGKLWPHSNTSAETPPEADSLAFGIEISSKMIAFCTFEEMIASCAALKP
jgi:hypothetical protein